MKERQTTVVLVAQDKCGTGDGRQGDAERHGQALNETCLSGAERPDQTDHGPVDAACGDGFRQTIGVGFVLDGDV